MHHLGVKITFTLLASLLPSILSAKKNQYKPFFINAGITQIITDKDLEKTCKNIIDFDTSILGFYFGLSSKSYRIEEQMYGSGNNISPYHNVCIIDLGYYATIKKTNNLTIGCVPYLSISSIEDQKEDLYYGEPLIVDTYRKLGPGIGLNFIIKRLSILAKVATTELSLSLGYDMGYLFY